MKKILIQLTSIKRNPNYGYHHPERIAGRRTVTFEYRGDSLPIVFEDGKNCTITQRTYSFNGFGYDTINGYITDPSVFEGLDKETLDMFNITAHQEWVDVHTLDSPEPYFYEYEKTELTCRYCGYKFDSEELGSDSMRTGDGELYSTTVCPECEGWDCVEGLEWETVEEALLRKAKAEAPTVEEFEQQVQDLNDFERKVIAKQYGVNEEDLK